MYRRASYHFSLTLLFVLILTTLVFGYLAFSRFDLNEMERRGDPSNPGSQSDSLVAKEGMAEELERDIVDLDRQTERLLDRTTSIDLELAANRLYYDDSVPGGEWVLGGEDDKSPWVRAREHVAFNTALIDNQAQTIEQTGDASHRPLEDLIRDLQDDLHGVMQEITDQDARLEQDREQLLDKLDDLEETKEIERERFATTRSELLTRKSQLESRIRELLELRLRWLDEVTPDGRILERELGGHYAVIDIGSSDRVFNGLQLEIFQYDRGRYLRKGFAEVIDTESNLATVRIVEEVDPRSEPITKGDMVGNPVFDTQESPLVVLAGEFTQFNREDLATFLERTGASVIEELGPGVDYLIAGDRSEPEQDRAREFRVTAMTEDQLVHFLHTSFAPAPGE